VQMRYDREAFFSFWAWLRHDRGAALSAPMDLLNDLFLFASNWLAKRLLKSMPELRFRAIVVSFTAISGVAMIWQQRETIAALL
jgi:uncharacterized membrane protein YfcA